MTFFSQATNSDFLLYNATVGYIWSLATKCKLYFSGLVDNSFLMGIEMEKVAIDTRTGVTMQIKQKKDDSHQTDYKLRCKYVLRTLKKKILGMLRPAFHNKLYKICLQLSKLFGPNITLKLLENAADFNDKIHLKMD